MIRKICFVLCFALIGNGSRAQSPQQIVDSLKQRLKTERDSRKLPAIYADLTWYYANISTDSAVAYGKKALAFAQKSKQNKAIGQAYSDLGAVYLAKGNFVLAKKYYRLSLGIRTQLHDREGMASNWSNIGGVYQRQQVLDTAMIYYLKALRYYESQQNEKYTDFLGPRVLTFQDTYKIMSGLAAFNNLSLRLT